MLQLTKLKISAIFGMSVAFGLLVGCGDDSSSASDLDNPFVVSQDTIIKVVDGDTIREVVTDTLHATVDTVMKITETGDTVYVADTVYISKDTTLRWIGNSALRITEISPLNLNWNDEDGDDGSWVEIYNSGDTDANLKGYALVENLESPYKWVFGNEIIKKRSFRTVFCDKKNLSEASSKADTDSTHSRTHTNWKMDKDGGTIYLIDQNYGIRDSVKYPEVLGGVSWGIVDGGSWKYFGTPTPEQPNTASTAYGDMAPSANLDGLKAGFYSDAININPPEAVDGVTIRCTQNGSEPTESSPEFNSPMTVDHNMVLRCAAFKEGTLTKTVVTKTFFIGETVAMPVVAISVDSNFFRQNYLTNLSCQDPDDCPSGLMADVEYPIHVEYFEKGSSSTEVAWEIDAGISLMGNWSRVYNKKSVAIVMREEYQEGWLNYPLFETRKGVKDKYKGFNLRNNGNRFVSDYFEDAAGGAVLEGSGVDYQRSRQVVVFYNGTYYGIHDMRERYNKNYVESNYDVDANDVNFVKHLGKEITASNGTTDAYLNMLNYVNSNDMSVDANYQMAKTLLDVGNFADYMTAEIYSHNGDWPVNNIRAWRTAEQPWKFMVYDLDHGYDWMWGTSGFSQSTNMFSWIKQGGTSSASCHSSSDVKCFHMLYKSLIKNENFKRMFINRSAMMLQNNLNATNVAKVVDYMASTLVDSEVDRDLAKFKQDEKYYSNSCGGGFSQSGSCLKTWAEERDSKVVSEYQSEFGVGDLVTVNLSASGNGKVLVEGKALSSTSYAGKFFSGNTLEITAEAAGGALFTGWSDGSTENPRIVTITDGASYTATFK